MKNTVTDVLKSLIDNVFSFGFFMFIAGLAVVYLLVTSSEQEQVRNAACYKVGMVKVRTDAGSYCVAPTNLVEIK